MNTFHAAAALFNKPIFIFIEGDMGIDPSAYHANDIGAVFLFANPDTPLTADTVGVINGYERVVEVLII